MDKIKSLIIKDFSKDLNDNTLTKGVTLNAFTGLDLLNIKKYFIGVNVKTSTKESVVPIQYSDSINYKGPKKEKIEKIIPNGLDKFCNEIGQEPYEKPFDVTFKWSKTNIEVIYSDNQGVTEKIFDFFKGLGPKIEEEDSEKIGYNVIGHVVDNSDWKGLSDSQQLFVWICTVDFDVRNGGQPLSYILAICETKDDLNDIKEKKSELYDYIMLVKAGYRKKIEDERTREAIKSAVAAIMSRNMSHNLGSHYLYYTKNQLAALADKHSENNDADSPDIRGAAKVLGYMQARMDYLATIVAGDKYPYGSVFFKGQIFDELTIDDFSKRHFQADKGEEENTGKKREYKRTTNYLLQNLILSENFTRSPVLAEENTPIQEGKKNIRLQIMTADSEIPFTGSSDREKFEEESEIKLGISKLCIALPGGIMSIHAFYNVVENLIRNSAKYNKEDFKEELVFTIRINEIEKTDDQPVRYEFIIFDNKANACKSVKVKDDTESIDTAKQKDSLSKDFLIESMKNRLSRLKILNDANALDKHDKGLKEMLFSTLWMRVYAYGSKYLSDILVEIDQAEEGSSRLEKITKYAFEYVAVDKNGDVQEPAEGQELNLGIRFELPKYRMMENVNADELGKNLADELGKNLIEKGLNNFTDILCVDKAYDDFPTLKTQFTRVSEDTVVDENDESEAVKRLKKILQKRFTDFDKYRLCMDTDSETGFDECNKRQYGIYFKTHLSDLKEMEKFSYCEAISGENFTKTMQNIFNNGLETNQYIDSSSEYFGLKIKESALTKITLIDERLYNDMKTSVNKEDVLSLKNIRVLNLKEKIQNTSPEHDIRVEDLFDGNVFRDETNATHFLSIHLGMIEKIIKDDSPWIEALKLKEAPLNERINILMAWLKESFKTEKGEVFISIHSGRGNFSPDLDESLKHYPFISISAIESAYSNSKYLLAQLFYNTVYIGKGVSNE